MKYQFLVIAEKNQMAVEIVVDANTHAHASRIVQASGYAVHDVSML